MAGSNEAEFRLKLDGDSSALSAIFAAFKREASSTLTEIERKTAQTKLFVNLDSDLKKSAQSLDQARASVASLTRAVDSLRESGEPAGKELTQALTQAQRAASAAEKDFVKQSEAVTKLRGTLKTAGVDVNNLAAAERQLAEETKRAAAAQVDQQNKMATGFRTLRDVQPEVNKVVAAYNALATSGKLTFGELSTLQAKATQQINTLRSSVTGLGQAFSDVRAGVVGFAAAFAGVIAAGAQSSANFREFSTQIAAIGTIAGVSDDKLQELSDGVRRLSREMGVDAVDSARALYDIIGSGIPTDNAISVLAQATQAARAGLTDVHTAASVGVVVLNGYGLQVDKLDHVYDVLFQTVKDGVVSFGELAQNIGNVIPIARAANVPLEELGAAFVVLTRQGVNAPEAATAISRAIQELAAPAPEAADKMRELGIQFDGLVGTVEAFSKKNLSLDQIQKLIPEARAAKAVLALAQNFDLLRDSVTSAANSAGSMQSAYERMAATPQAKVDRFNASIKDLSLSVGEFITNASGFIETLTRLTNAFNGMGTSAKTTTLQILAITGGLTALYALVRTLAVPLNLLAGAMANFGTSGALALQGLSAVTVAITGLQVAISGLLGFKVGEILYEWSGAVRVVGDVLGTFAASVSAVVGLIGGGLWNALTLNIGGLQATWEQFRQNAAIISEGYVAALTGAGEATRASAQRQAELGASLNRTAKAAADAAGQVDTAVTAIISKLDTQAKAAEAALTATQAKLTGLVSSLTKGVQNITQGAQAAIAGLAASVQTQIAALTSVDVQKVRDTVALQKQAAIDRIAILQQMNADILKAFEAEATARRQIAIKSGEDLKRVDLEIAQARVVVLDGLVEKQRAHVNELLAIEQGHLQKIREIEDQRRGINQDVAEQIRNIRKQGLSEYGKYQSDIQEIDRLTSEARKALANGDNKLAEEYSKKAISLANSVTNAVKDGERDVVSASSAQATAIGKIQTAQDILNRSLNERVSAEKAGAEAAAERLKTEMPRLDELIAKQKEAVELAKQGITMRINADAKAVTEAVDVLEKQLKERELTLKLIADLKSADEAIKKAKADLEQGIPVPLIAKTEALNAAVQAVKDAKPELTVETTAALAKIEDLRAKAQAIEAVKPVVDVTVNSNAADVQAEIDNLKQPTESTHTIYVRRVETNAAGGMVGWGRRAATAVQKFAQGGRVLFRRPGWDKVPGTGNQDTVPALLNAGSFVVKKAASAFYGDGLMGRLAGGVQRFATGGNVLKPGSIADRILVGGKNRGSLSGGKEFEAYRDVLAMLYELRENSLDLVKSSTGLDINEWSARLISKFPLFDTKRKDKIKKLMEDGFEGMMATIETARKFRVPAVMEFAIASLAFQKGGGGKGLGSGTDTVPAMLTPGEWVINRGAVARYGAGLMHAINNMMLPRETLAGMLAAPVPVSRFAMGGQVGGGAIPEVSMPRGGGNYSITVNAQTFDERFVRRELIPMLREIDRRSS